MKTHSWIVYTDATDPTRITMRRADADEVVDMLREEMAAALAHLMLPPLDPLPDFKDVFSEPSPPVDPKAEARRRSREDVQRKRRELRKGRR